MELPYCNSKKNQILIIHKLTIIQWQVSNMADMLGVFVSLLWVIGSEVRVYQRPQSLSALGEEDRGLDPEVPLESLLGDD